MTTKLVFAVELEDGTNVPSYLARLKGLGGRVTIQAQIRYIDKLRAAGFPTQLAQTLSDNFGVNEPADLTRLSEEDLLDPAKRGIGPRSLRRIIWLLARQNPPLRLAGSLDIEPSDLIEQLELLDHDYLRLRRAGVRSVRPLQAMDGLERRALGLRHRVYDLLKNAGFDPEPVPLQPGRTLRDLGKATSAVGLLIEHGFRLSARLRDLTADAIRERFKTAGASPDDALIALQVLNRELEGLHAGFRVE